MRKAYRYGISSAAAIAIVALASVPEASWSAAPPVCLFRNLVDSECLGCGMTRALAAAARGRWAAAWEFNRGVVVAAPLLVGCVLQAFWIRR